MITLFNLPDWMPHPGYFKAHAATAYLYNETMKAVAARRAPARVNAIFWVCCCRRAIRKPAG